MIKTVSEELPAPGRLARAELPICLAMNHVRSDALRGLMGAVSRLGNGWFWIAAACLLVAIESGAALPALRHLALAALVSTVLYKTLKRWTARPRPFASGEGFRLTVDPLDEFSFPSGHTLHAVAFTLVIQVYCPVLLWVVLPFTVLVAMSRIILGLHYLTDVLAGAVLGSTVALLVLEV